MGGENRRRLALHGFEAPPAECAVSRRQVFVPYRKVKHVVGTLNRDSREPGGREKRGRGSDEISVNEVWADFARCSRVRNVEARQQCWCIRYYQYYVFQGQVALFSFRTNGAAAGMMRWHGLFFLSSVLQK